MTDLQNLLDMGFEEKRAQMALKASGNLTSAIDWLDKNQEKSLEELQEEQAAESSTSNIPEVDPDAQANSLQCDVCGKKFRNASEAQFHATKSGHDEFSQSTEIIAPLTEEEKKAKLEELRARLAAKRAEGSEQDKLDKKKNEEIRRKATKESADIKEDLRKREQLKDAQKAKMEKKAEADARKRALEKIEADKMERKRKADAEKAARAGIAPPPQPEVTGPTSHGPTTSKPASAYTETRLRLQTPSGTVMKNFPVETTLFEVAHALNSESGLEVQSFTQNFPKKVFDSTDFGMTLKEAGMVPSAALIVR
ncbi:putative UBX domain protein [Patellaria atrata CBS 101060]|uniref:UBX domain protein n=1 Tax=Patellaria atrata CBS 101060 TaxID=1346257 RepID=A0A9P4SF92_9PEZI|nr:putative UBX domain protein [Patellaria atrata CBS 101060]